MRKPFFVLSLIFLVISSFAQTSVTMNTTGNWSDATKWASSNIGDVITENVTFANNVNPTVLGTDNYTVGTVSFGQNNQLTIKSGGKLTLGSSSASKSMTTGMNAKITVEAGATLTIWGDLSIPSNIQLTIAGSLIVHGNISISGSSSNFGVTGTIQVDGSFTGSGNNDTTITGTGKINVNGNVNVPSGNLNGPVGSFVAHGTCTGSYCSSSTLPIQLISFSAKPSDTEIYLKWSTLSEQNFDYFIIEKSTNGYTFHEVGRISGHGTTTTQHDYQWVDEKALIGTNYYRLIEVDFDASIIPLKTINADFSGQKKLALFPNPVAEGKLTFELNFNPDQPVAVSILDLRGAVLSEFLLDRQSMTVPLTIASGQYMVLVRGNNFRSTESLVVK